MVADWSQLPPDLLESIAKRLTVEDFIRINTVCIPWRSILIERTIHSLPNRQLPWLMLPDANTYCDFYSFSENKVHRIELPEVCGRRCCGSSHGWLVMVENSPSIFLLNPLTRSKIPLPPVTTFPEILDFRVSEVGNEYLYIDCCGDESTQSLEHVQSLYMGKVILTENPSTNEDYTAVAICGEIQRLALCRKGDERWTVVQQDEPNAYLDLVNWRGQCYAMDSSGGLVVCDLSAPIPTVKTIVSPPVHIPGVMKHLAVSSGELMLVTRHTNSFFAPNDNRIVGGDNNNDNDDNNIFFYKTVKFEVFRLDEDTLSWMKVENLGDQTLFLGNNVPLTFSARDFPECKANHIYFTDSYRGGYTKGVVGGHDLGVFNMETGTIESLPCSHPQSSWLFWPPPIWVTPNLF